MSRGQPAATSRHRKRAAALQDRALLELVRAAVRKGAPTPIWVEYGAAHFPWGSGEFEDDTSAPHIPGPRGAPVCSCAAYDADRTPRCRGHYSQLSALRYQPYACPCGSKRAMAATGHALAPGSRPPCTSKACLPLGECISPHSAARLAMVKPYVSAGARLLPMWDVTRPMFHAHLWHSATDTSGGKPTASLPLDCRHWCNPGSVPLAWSRRLYALLIDPQRNLTDPAAGCSLAATAPSSVQVCGETASNRTAAPQLRRQ